MTASQWPSPDENGEQNEMHSLSGEMETERSADSAVDGDGLPVPAQPSRARVDARALASILLNLRKRIAAVPLVFDVPGAGEVAAERAKLLSQIDDYLLPRVSQSAAPLLVAVAGSTGAGKSTLMNSIVGTRVSMTGVRRPTTNSPVLVCHPDDAHWFAEDMFLPTLPRVRQDGIARAGRDGLLVLAESDVMTRGIALLDTPDIDSVAHAHHDFAHRFLDTADLWLLMTSATRYADAPVWQLLQHAMERGAALGVILSRVPEQHRTELVEHFTAMLDANGITTEHRFVIPEADLADGFLPKDVVGPVRDWLDETAAHGDRRVAVLTQTMSGMLDTFSLRVPRLAAHVNAQLALRARLRQDAESAYLTALNDFDEATHGASLLTGEVLARWQDYAESGDMEAVVRGRRGPLRRGSKRTHAASSGGRYAALEEALRATLGELVVSIGDRAAEHVARAWRDNPGGAALLSAAEERLSRHERAKREFEETFGPVTAGPPSAADEAEAVRTEAFARSAPDLPLRVARAVSAWQDQLTRQWQPDAERRPVSGGAQLSGVALVAMLCAPRAAGGLVPAPRDSAAASEAGEEAAAALAALFGDAPSQALLARARHDLKQRVGLLLDEEMLRFAGIIDEAGDVDDAVGAQLYQAEHALEDVR